MEIDNSTIEHLRQYFPPSIENKTGMLPDIRTVSDGTFIIIQNDTEHKLYLATKGKWYLVATLTEFTRT